MQFELWDRRRLACTATKSAPRFIYRSVLDSIWGLNDNVGLNSPVLVSLLS